MAKQEYPPVRGRARVFAGAAAATRLREIDQTLKPRLFVKATEFGKAEANQTLSTEPLMAYGTTRSNKIIGSLRADLKDVEWTPIDVGNHALSVNEAGTVAIVVCSGDSNVCIDDPLVPEPQPANPKGPLIRFEVENNISHLQGTFGEVAPNSGFPLPEPIRSQGAAWDTWVLLYHHDAETGEIKAELSLPDELETVGEGDHVTITGWLERIFVQVSGPGPSRSGRRDDEGEPDGPIDVPVERRTG